MLNLLDYTIIFLSTEGFRLAGLGNNRNSGTRRLKPQGLGEGLVNGLSGMGISLLGAIGGNTGMI